MLLHHYLSFVCHECRYVFCLWWFDTTDCDRRADGSWTTWHSLFILIENSSICTVSQKVKLSSCIVWNFRLFFIWLNCYWGLWRKLNADEKVLWNWLPIYRFWIYWKQLLPSRHLQALIKHNFPEQNQWLSIQNKDVKMPKRLWK